jgi:hypothetical protein
VNNRQTTTGTEKKLDIIGRTEMGEQIFNISRNVTVAFSSARTIHDNTDRIKKVLNVEIT